MVTIAKDSAVNNILCKATVLKEAKTIHLKISKKAVPQCFVINS